MNADQAKQVAGNLDLALSAISQCNYGAAKVWIEAAKHILLSPHPYDPACAAGVRSTVEQQYGLVPYDELTDEEWEMIMEAAEDEADIQATLEAERLEQLERRI
jgi:hypothetical protein